MTTEEMVRRGRGNLEADVKGVTDRFASGDLHLEAGKLLTAHRIAKQIQLDDDLERAPSTGAILNVLKRWATIGFCTLNDSPCAFMAYTDAAWSDGLAQLKVLHRERRKAAVAELAEAASEPAPDTAA